MGKDLASIEDLIKHSQGQTSGKTKDDSTQSKFDRKQTEIKLKQMEQQVEEQANDYGIPYVRLFGFPISPEALSLINEADAQKLRTVCFYYDGENLRIGTTQPDNPAIVELLEELKAKFYSDGKVYLISDRSLDYALDLYRILPKVRKFSTNLEITENDLNKFSEKFTSFHDLQNEINNAQITDVVSMIMASAIKANASDVHIEAEERNIKVRFRIDGVLLDSASIDKDQWRKIISRLKILTKVKINVTDKPQDGRLSIVLKNDRVDIRASFLPTNFGESVVMRLLRSSSVRLAFDDLGLRGRAFEQMQREVQRPNGMIITTGPTGSGKTTTLYAILSKLNNAEMKIITIEDPVEYQLEGVNQSQVSEKYTFAQGLRSIVRQDPDVVMVGEIRDLETAEIAIQASLTGHLVLSTIHTNDASGTIPRFLSMGVKPFLLAPAMNAMIGQRLVRRLCDKCKQEIKLDNEIEKRVLEILNKMPEGEKEKVDMKKMKFFEGKGCDACQSIGYKGRIGIYEIMVMNEKIEKLILAGNASEYDMQNAAVANGMVTMVQDGVLKAMDGITSISEVFRVAEEK